MSLIVFGSLNMDLVAQTPRMPILGETVLGHHFFTSPGGKGANQAVAAARLGVKTYMVGRVGGDQFGEALLASLQNSGVITDGVFKDEGTHSGVAIITVNQQGENQIVLVPGANGRINQTDVERLIPLFSDATALLLQLEIPLEAVIAAAKLAKKAGVKVILDPAPVLEEIPEEIYPLADIITPNEVEASELVGFPVQDVETAREAALEFRKRGVGIAVVKLGAKGAFVATESEQFFQPAFPVVAVDTVAAGDAFNGAIAVAFAKGYSLREAIAWGAAAGALAVTKIGAQSSLPSQETFNHFIQENYRLKVDDFVDG